jgi:hypothetical protein
MMDRVPVKEVDRMINEGLGAGFIIYDYDFEKYKPLTVQRNEENEEGSEKQ